MVTKGQIEIVRPASVADTVVRVFRPGEFTGEANMLSGRPALVLARAIEAGEVIELDRESLLSLVQTDSEIGEIIMRAFILRRVELIASGLGDVVLVGSSRCSGTLRVKEFLTRNGHPYSSIDLDRDEGVEALLDHFKVSAADVPVVICRGEPRSYAKCMADAVRYLPRLLPPGSKVTLRCWNERPGGARLHNRYLLTDIGGVQFGDEIEVGDPGHEDRMSILDEPSLAKLWDHYTGTPPAFDAAGEAQAFIGTLR